MTLYVDCFRYNAIRNRQEILACHRLETNVTQNKMSYVNKSASVSKKQGQLYLMQAVSRAVTLKHAKEQQVCKSSASISFST